MNPSSLSGRISISIASDLFRRGSNFGFPIWIGAADRSIDPCYLQASHPGLFKAAAVTDPPSFSRLPSPWP